MAQEADVPGGMIDRIRKMISDAIAEFARSGFLRNASITEGGLTIKGGFFRMLSAVTDGISSFYVGPITPALPDGSYQPGWIVRRNDGTPVLVLWDPRPDLDGYTQFLGWYDRTDHAIFTDDTTSGVGHARPWLGHSFYPARVQDFPKTTAGGFETIYRALVSKQQPRLYVEAWCATDTAGTTGEVRVMVNGVQLGSTRAATAGVVTGWTFGPAAVAGGYGDTLSVEIQARRTAGTGSVQVGAAWVEGRQS